MGLGPTTRSRLSASSRVYSIMDTIETATDAQRWGAEALRLTRDFTPR